MIVLNGLRVPTGTQRTMMTSAARPLSVVWRDEAALEERVAALAELSLFQGLSPDALLPLARGSDLIEFHPGDFIVRQGEPGHSVYLILEGRVEVLARSIRDGVATESVVSSLFPGDSLGELSILDEQPRSASCIAAAATTCLRLSRESLLAAMRQNWPIAQALMAVLARRLRHADELLAEQARDPLTGVNNRRALIDLYQRESRRAQRALRQVMHPLRRDDAGASTSGHVAAHPGPGHEDAALSVPLALLFIDVDRFKTINDTYGHKMGDEVLRAVARTLTAAGRATDHVGRLGGDEFAMLLPESGLTGAHLVRDRIRARIVAHAAAIVPFTVSIGAAVVDPLDPPTFEQAMAYADREMYADKQRLR